MIGGLYRRAVASFIYRTFGIWQRLGIHLTCNYYGTPIPDTGRLDDALWSKRSGLAGIDMNEKEQLGLLSIFESRFKEEYAALPRDRGGPVTGFYLNNPLFRSPDAELAYCMVRHFKPRRILEIGAGYSTLLLARALRANGEEDGGCRGELLANEPYPKSFLEAGLREPARLVLRAAQEVPLSEFQELAGNDVLFIDSSHIVKIGSDVEYLVLEVLPGLGKGVLVHFHDIFMPTEYPKETIVNRQFFFNEQYLLQAFLTFNDSFTVLFANRYMKLAHPDRMERAFGPGGAASSLWMTRTK